MKKSENLWGCCNHAVATTSYENKIDPKKAKQNKT